jgi:hypothetical protein
LKIKVLHDACGREVLVHQILESQGHCPWDGKPFNKDYTGVLAGALEAAERFGGQLETALERIAQTGGHMTIDEDTVLGPLRAQLERLNRAGEGVRA